MEFITITPTNFMKDAFLTSNKTLVLAHLIEEGNDYQKACLEFKKAGGELWLDNSFYELRENKGIPWLVHKAKLIDADLIVFPDTALKINLKYIVSSGIAAIKRLGYKGKIMVNVFADNKNFKDDLENFKILNSIDTVDVLAIPYVFRKEDEMRRPYFLEMIEKRVHVNEIKKPVHIFGVNSLKNLKRESKFKWVTSADSTLPWKMGYYKHKLNLQQEKDKSRPKDYFSITEVNEAQRECIKYNSNFIKEVIQNERSN